MNFDPGTDSTEEQQCAKPGPVYSQQCGQRGLKWTLVVLEVPKDRIAVVFFQFDFLGSIFPSARLSATSTGGDDSHFPVGVVDNLKAFLM